MSIEFVDLGAERLELLRIAQERRGPTLVFPLDRIARGVPQVTLLKLEQCGHAQRRDQPNAVMEAISKLAARVGAGSIEPRK